MARLNRKQMQARDKRRKGNDRRWEEFLRVENKKAKEHKEKQN